MAIIYDPTFDWSVLDKSVPEDELETPSIDTSLGCLFATFTSRGIHNKIVECRTSSAIKTTFGDDFANYGGFNQTNITALRVAKSGGRAFICSLIPNNAKVAYSLFGVSIKNVEGIPVYKRNDTVLSEDGTAIINIGKGSFVKDADGNKIQIKLRGATEGEEILATTNGVTLKVETRSFDPVENAGYFDSNGNPTGFDGEPIVTEEDDGEGGVVTTTFYPLFMLYYYAKGKGGNFFAYRISRDLSRDKKIKDGRRYTIRFYEILSSGTYKALFDGEEFPFSFNKDAVYSEVDSTSEALHNVYNNLDEKTSEPKTLQLITYPESYDALVEAIATAGASEEENNNLIDIMNGIYQNGNPYNKIVMDGIDVANTLITLENGDDGDLDPATHTAEQIAKTKEELLINFFSCDVDDDIFDEKMVDADVLPDCNYSEAVKKTILSTFSIYRPDIFLAIDLGIVRSNAEAIASYREYNSYVNTEYGYMVGFYGHAGYLKDKAIDGSARTITGTYDWVGGLADEFATANGAFQMRAGANRGKVKYMIPFHVCKKNKANELEELEDLGINHIQYLTKSKQMVWMLESTQYTIETSKLMSVRNALVIGRLIRMCAGILPYYKYDERTISSTLSSAKEALETARTQARIPSTIGVSFDLYQTKADVKAENAHCAIDVTFPNYIKKFHVVVTAKRETVSE